jgi:signal transduction histidine kinase
LSRPRVPERQLIQDKYSSESNKYHRIGFCCVGRTTKGRSTKERLEIPATITVMSMRFGRDGKPREIPEGRELQFRRVVRVSPERLCAFMSFTPPNSDESHGSSAAAHEERVRLASLQASVSVALIEATSMPEMLGRCATAIVRELNVAFARVWTLAADGVTLELRASAGMYTRIDGTHSRIRVGQFKIGMIAKERVAVLSNAVVGDPQIHDQEWAKREGLVAFAGHPLLVDERLVGVLALFSRTALPADTLSALAAVANAIALGIERKTSEQALLARNAELVGIQNQLESRVRERTAQLELQIAERKRFEDSLRELTSRLLQLQDEERRRIARELHDSAGQMLAALGMNVSKLHRVLAKSNPELHDTTSDSMQLIEELSTEIRTLSYLLHPPLLDESGLASALSWYTEGLAARSKIAVDLQVSSDLGRMHPDLETAIFRIVQECLTNIHRHSGSPTAEIQIRRENGEVHVRVADQGKGLRAEEADGSIKAQAGVGLRGMQERVRQLGGTLEISSGDADTPGTRVTAVLPFAARDEESSE